MSAAPLFSVIIPVYNKWELTRQCLHSLHEHTRGVEYEVLVMDNASQDDTAQALAPCGQELFGPRFRHIRFEENRNFGPACNEGARAAAAPYVFFLNNDTLLTPGWHEPLCEALAAKSPPGAVGPLLLYEDDTVQHLGVSFTLFAVEHLYRGFPATHPLVSQKRKLQAITAAAMMTEREFFLSLGGFFEEYRNGFEDVDLCLRMRAKGRSLVCVPDSRIYHLESRTRGAGDGDAANAALLASRCSGLYRPDKHVLGSLDGFEARINDAYDIALFMKPEAEKALSASVDCHDLCALREAAASNPLWVSGRKALLERYEQKGMEHEALSVLADLAHVCMETRLYSILADKAVALGNVTVEAEARKRLQLFESRRGNREYQRQLLRRARDTGDRALARLYTEKMVESR